MKAPIKAIEVSGEIESDRRVVLDEPLPAGLAGRVRIIIFAVAEELDEREWMRAAAAGGAFDFLNAPEEDLYSLNDGKPFDDAR